LAILALYTSESRAGDLQLWPSASYTVLKAGPLELGVEGSFRFRESVGDLYDRRFGAALDIGIGKGVSVSAGYVARKRDLTETSTVGEQRLLAGVSYPLLARGALLLEVTTVFERHLVASPVRDFNRYRQRFELGFDRTGFSPLLYQDFAILEQSGLLRSRSRAGIQWDSGGGYTLAVSYQFEMINLPGTSSWLPRHSIVTSFEIEKPIWTR
ncbi:MAG: DUF2490 domain-containing protein, partial [bacterium]|nr:DUF2490 domain-containing protein [bacterium]